MKILPYGNCYQDMEQEGAEAPGALSEQEKAEAPICHQQSWGS